MSTSGHSHYYGFGPEPDARSADGAFERGRVPPAENVATKAGRRAISDQIESMCDDLELVFTAEHGRPFGEPVTKALTDELMDIAERLRE